MLEACSFDGEQLLSLLLLEHAHLIFEDFALQKALSLVLDFLERALMTKTRFSEQYTSEKGEYARQRCPEDYYRTGWPADIRDERADDVREKRLTESARSKKAGGLCFRSSDGWRLLVVVVDSSVVLIANEVR